MASPLIERLKRIGYNGWLTVHQPLRDGEDANDAMRTAAEFFLPMIRE